MVKCKFLIVLKYGFEMRLLIQNPNVKLRGEGVNPPSFTLLLEYQLTVLYD